MRHSTKMWIGLMTAIGLTTPVLSTEQRDPDTVELSHRNKRLKMETAPTTEANDLEIQPAFPTNQWIIMDLLSWLDGKDFIRASHVCTGWRAAANQIGCTKSLDLSGRRFHETDYQNLRTIPIGHLILNNCALNDDAARILSQKSGLKALYFRNNNISAAGTQALALLTNLTTLDIETNRIGAAGARSLTALTNLTRLDIGYNDIGPAARTALKQRFNHARINF